jgi:carbon-monoxide dehydrogenase medium subunit
VEPFEFIAPASVDQAVAALREEDTVALGGGTSFVMMWKQNLVSPSRVVWLGRIPELRGISAGGDGSISIGAGATLHDLEVSEAIRRSYPSLAEAASGVGNPRVRSVATVGGNLAHADPCQDLPPLLLAIGARAELVGPSGGRTVDLDSFFVDYMQTAIEDGEVLTRVILPPAPAGRRARYIKFTPRSQDDFATVGVAARLDLGPDGRVAGAALALGGVGPTPILVREAAEHLVGGRPGPGALDQVADAAVRASAPWDDLRGSEAYKRAMTRVWTRRALEGLLA